MFCTFSISSSKTNNLGPRTFLYIIIFAQLTNHHMLNIANIHACDDEMGDIPLVSWQSREYWLYTHCLVFIYHFEKRCYCATYKQWMWKHNIHLGYIKHSFWHMVLRPRVQPIKQMNFESKIIAVISFQTSLDFKIIWFYYISEGENNCFKC